MSRVKNPSMVTQAQERLALYNHSPIQLDTLYAPSPLPFMSPVPMNFSMNVM